MKKIISKLFQQPENERAYTLLEYCAGAAIIAGILWVALDSMGGSMQELIESLGSWLDRRSESLDSSV